MEKNEQVAFYIAVQLELEIAKESGSIEHSINQARRDVLDGIYKEFPNLKRIIHNYLRFMEIA